MGQTFTTFGVSVLLLIGLGYLFGEDAKEVSSLFRLGRGGLTAETMLQFLVVAAGTTLGRFLFFTDAVIKKSSVPKRTIGMLLFVVVLIAIMSASCGWFPVHQWQPWALFFLAYGKVAKSTL